MIAKEAKIFNLRFVPGYGIIRCRIRCTKVTNAMANRDQTRYYIYIARTHVLLFLVESVEVGIAVAGPLGAFHHVKLVEWELHTGRKTLNTRLQIT
jgi:hypothetical protein